jgi:hypothetical protein
MKKLFLSILLILLVSTVAFAGQDVKFAWDPYTADPIVGFKLYMASAPGVAITSLNLVATITGQAAVNYTQVNAPVGQKYWVLTAYTASMESGPSNEVSYMVKLKPPSGLGSSVVLTFGSVSVTVVAK